VETAATAKQELLRSYAEAYRLHVFIHPLRLRSAKQPVRSATLGRADSRWNKSCAQKQQMKLS